jgi:hypothetical protein
MSFNSFIVEKVDKVGMKFLFQKQKIFSFLWCEEFFSQTEILLSKFVSNSVEVVGDLRNG